MSKRLVECFPVGPVEIRIDFKPGYTSEELDDILLDQIKRHGSKAIKSCLTFFVPEKLTPVLLNLCNMDHQKKGVSNHSA